MSAEIPYSDRIEKAVLGTALCFPQMVSEILSEPEDIFFQPASLEIRGVLEDMMRAGEEIDQIRVAERLFAPGSNFSCTNAFFMECISAGFTTLTLPGYSRDLRELRAKRQLAKLAETLTKMTVAGVNSTMIASEAQTTLADIQEGGNERQDACLLSDFSATPEDPQDETLRNGYLRKGGGLLIAAPSGIGKSVLAMQCAVSWGIGWHTLGIAPTRPLRSLIIQGENDATELAEMRDGVFQGLALSPDERKRAAGNIRVESNARHTGSQFFARDVEPLLRRHRPDLLWIDPVFSYLGGDASSQKDVSAFLRQGLNPLLHTYQCAAVLVHHSNKPSRGKEKAEWSGGDFAYLGSGSAEWANWARAVLAIQSVGSHEAYWLHAGKRGGRLGWTDEQGERTYRKAIAHATEPGVLCWREMNDADMPGEPEPPKGRPKKAVGVLEYLNGSEHTFTEICGQFPTVSSRTVKRHLADLKAEGRATTDPTTGKWRAL